MTSFEETGDLFLTGDLSASAWNADLIPLRLENEIRGYELEKKIGEGAFGQVWQAVQLSTGQAVAVKLYKTKDPVFLRELERIVKLGSHPYLVSILDADLDHDPAFIVAPLLQGSLSEWMKIHAHSPGLNERVLHWLRQAAMALGYMHRRGIYHCDIKPQNILLDSQENLRIADFGQAQTYGEGARLGTFFFMSPDQVLAAKNGYRKSPASWDLYALGATFYWLLTSYVPRATSASLRQMQQIQDFSLRLKAYWVLLQRSSLRPIVEYNPGVQIRLAMAIERCLNLNPARRYQDAPELISDLDEILSQPRSRLDEAVYYANWARIRLGL